jgi:hypothetical protein
LWASFFSLASPNGKFLEKQQILTWQIFYQVAKIEDLASGISGTLGDALRPCLVHLEIQKIFKIFYHIESYGTFMKHKI